jgi:hypothetical protein
MIKPGDLVCVTRKCCERSDGEFMGATYTVSKICEGDCLVCGVGHTTGMGYVFGGSVVGFALHQLTKIDPLKEPETVEEEAHA